MAAKKMEVISGAMHTWSSATLLNTARGLVGSAGITYCRQQQAYIGITVSIYVL
jgi:hypothetical protein